MRASLPLSLSLSLFLGNRSNRSWIREQRADRVRCSREICNPQCGTRRHRTDRVEQPPNHPIADRPIPRSQRSPSRSKEEKEIARRERSIHQVGAMIINGRDLPRRRLRLADDQLGRSINHTRFQLSARYRPRWIHFSTEQPRAGAVRLGSIDRPGRESHS